MIYLVVFAMAYALFYAAGKSKGALSWACASLGVLLICLFAALRDETVGTDVRTYGIGTFNSAVARSLPDHLNALSASNAPLFSILTWLSARLTGTLNGMLFFIQLSAVLPAYVGMRKVAKGDAAICMLVYFLLVFPFSMNALKQGIAVSFVFLAGVYAFGRKPKPFAVFIVLAVGFHLTALLGVLLYPLAVLLGDASGDAPLRKGAFAFLAVAIALGYGAAFLFGEQLVRLVAPVRDAYAYQVRHIGMGDVSYSMLVLLVVLVVAGVPCLDDGDDGVDREFAYFFLVSVIGAALFQIDVIAESLSRFAYYGLVFVPVTYQMILRRLARENLFYAAGLFAVMVAVFVYSVIVMGHQEVYPYTSSILGLS